MNGIVAVVTGPGWSECWNQCYYECSRSNKVRVVIVLTKNVVEVISLVL